MELCKAFDSPLLLPGKGGRFQPSGARKIKRFASTCQSHRMLMLRNFGPSQLQVRNFVHKAPIMSILKGNFKRPVCMGLCKVSWTVQADIEDGQLLYITGDPVELGSWDPEMAIILTPSNEHVNLWMTEIKVPSGILFKYNYFIKEENHSYQNLMWRPGPEFFLSVPLFRKKSESITVRDLWLKTTMENPPIPTWGSWTDGTQFSLQIKVAGNQASSGGKHKVLKSSESEAFVVENFATNIFSNGGNSSFINDLKLNAADAGQSITERQHPVEEPWLLSSTLSSLQDSSTFCIVNSPDNGESTKTELPSPGLETTDIIRHVDEHKLVHVEKHISTVILINSSVCTMQRIAILEDGKLVELLLEPVKNNVQCDSVYLGVVTKLVPHMGGAFVDIGITRPSLMDIKPSREPFTYPPFSTTATGQEVNGSATTVPEILDAHEHELTLYDSESISDEILEVDHQEDSLEYEDEDAEENGVEDVMDDSDPLERNTTNGSTVYNGTEADLGYDYNENEHTMESEVSEEFLPLEIEGSGSLDPSDMLLPDPSDAVSKRSDRNKWGHVRKGTKVIVQVVKEGLGTKGPALTAYPNLRSRFWILITQCNRIGVSKKITGAERTRLRVIAKALQPPKFGLTVRTVAAGHSLEELQKDLEGLLSTWKGIIEQAKSAALAADEGVEGAVPVILHRAMGQTLSVVQDYFNDNVESMIIDSPRTYHEVSNYLQDIAPDLCDRVLLYNKRIPLFDDHGIEEEINSILSKRVPLSNGGSLVIEQTEALVSIDVNGGHSMLGQGTSQEKAVLDVNLAAAKRIAQELRLRDIGGIIVVDFIDMADESNKRLVYEEIKKAVERDRSIVKVSELSKHGLMEITRKRVRPSVSFFISEPCTCCHGTGRVEALETSYSKIEREICRLLASDIEKADPGNAKSWPRFVLKVDRYMCNYLTSGKRTKLAVLSSSLKVWILLKVARGFSRGAFEVKPFADDRSNDETPVTISRLHHTEARPYIPNSRLTLFPIKKWKTRGR